MASFDKFTANEVGMLLKHNNRMPDDGVEHSNEDIDNERTMFNYHLKKGNAKDISKRVSEVFSCYSKPDTVVLGEIVVTLPKDVKQEDERTFFKSVYDFYCEDFGERNIINAVVHKDESKPHIHIDFVPIVKDKVEFADTIVLHGQMSWQTKALMNWKVSHGLTSEDEVERLCCKDLITKNYLKTMHPRLSAFVEDKLGYEVEILNGATINGNKKIQEMKVERLKDEVAELELQKTNLKLDINKIHNQMRATGIRSEDLSVMPLLNKIDDLQNKIKVLQQIILRNQCSYTQEDLRQMKKTYEPSLSSKLNIYDGTLTNENIEQRSIIIIETYDKIERPLPQQKLIDRSSDIKMQMTLARRSNDKVIMKKSRMSERYYLFLKTDSERQTIDNLIEAERILSRTLQKQKYKIYMDKIVSDKYDFALSILTKLNTEVLYFTNKKIEDESFDRENRALSKI